MSVGGTGKTARALFAGKPQSGGAGSAPAGRICSEVGNLAADAAGK